MILNFSFSQGSLNLTQDGIELNFSTTGDINHIQTFPSIVSFNITMFYSGNQNYSSFYETHFVNVAPPASAVSFIFPNYNNTVPHIQLGRHLIFG